MSIEEYVRHPNRRVAFEAAAGALIYRSGARFLRKRIPPSFPELTSLTSRVHSDAESLLLSATWSEDVFSAETLTQLANEHVKLKDELRDRYESRSLPFPGIWAVEEGTSLLLYSLVRRMRPTVIVEMGVGNGQSSYFITRALETNGNGVLYSFDIEPQAGGLLEDRERAHWDFRLIDRRQSARSLVSHLGRLPRAGLCFHDAGHKYLAQHFDFARLWDQLNEAGVLVIDDVDASYALIDFCRSHGTQPEILIDGRKAIGVLSR